MKPEVSIGTGLAVAGIVYAIHSNFTPNMADMQGLPAGNTDIDASERKATWLSVGVVAGISLIAKDPTVFVIGSVAAVAMAFFTRHAVWTDTKAGPVTMTPGAVATSANDLATGPSMGDTTGFSNSYGSPLSEFVSS